MNKGARVGYPKVERRSLVMLEPTDENLSAFVLKDRDLAWSRVGQRRFAWIIEAYVGQRRGGQPGGIRPDWYLCRCVCGSRWLVPISTLTISPTGLTNRCHRTCGCQLHRPQERWELSPTVINQIADVRLEETDRLKKMKPSKQKTPESRAARSSLKDLMKAKAEDLPPGITREDLEWQQAYMKKFERRMNGAMK